MKVAIEGDEALLMEKDYVMSPTIYDEKTGQVSAEPDPDNNYRDLQYGQLVTSKEFDEKATLYEVQQALDSRNETEMV